MRSYILESEAQIAFDIHMYSTGSPDIYLTRKTIYRDNHVSGDGTVGQVFWNALGSGGKDPSKVSVRRL